MIHVRTDGVRERQFTIPLPFKRTDAWDVANDCTVLARRVFFIAWGIDKFQVFRLRAAFAWRPI